MIVTQLEGGQPKAKFGTSTISQNALLSKLGNLKSLLCVEKWGNHLLDRLLSLNIVSVCARLLGQHA